MNQIPITHRWLFAACTTALFGLGAWQCVNAADEHYYKTPIEAADALINAARGNNLAALREVLGTDHEEIYATEDEAADLERRQTFAERAAEDLLFRPLDEGTLEIVVGDDQWPLPIPLIREEQGWRFDAAAGVEEIINRRIGHNELLVIEVCETIVAAQELFRDRDWDSNGEVNYAATIISTPGQFDGLYWPHTDGVLPSPLDEFVDSNQDYLSKRETGSPVRGYRATLLTSQGAAAPGGAMDFMEGGLLRRGWAMVAWPAEYGVTGVMTFIVSNDGIVYQRNLGAESESIAKAMAKYDPTPEWTPVDEQLALRAW